MTYRNALKRLSKMEGIEVYLPEKERRHLIQAKVSADLCKEARLIMRDRGYTWNEVIDACLRKFVDEMKRR